MFNVLKKLDAVNPTNQRITTFEVTFPKFLLAQFNTHRLFSRNAASSRAIPTAKILEAVIYDPVLPLEWGKNQPGMSASEQLPKELQTRAMDIWMAARNDAIRHARELSELGAHKQIVNRLLEPFTWATVIVTATNYTNFFAQRCSGHAQPEIEWVANKMADLYYENAPEKYEVGAWYTPYIQPDEYTLISLLDRCKISVARCARVSYTNQDKIKGHEEDLALFDKLCLGNHWSPFEHVAQCCVRSTLSGNFHGWLQYRKTFPNEMKTTFQWEKNNEPNS